MPGVTSLYDNPPHTCPPVRPTPPSLDGSPLGQPRGVEAAQLLVNYSRDAFLLFSGGPRGCIKCGFAEIAGVVALSRYRVEVPERPRSRRESFEEHRMRLLKS